MRDMVFIGDKVTALGFRLAGVPSFSPEPDAVAAVVAAEREDCRVLAMTAEMLAALPARLAQDLAQTGTPLLAVLPDARGALPVPDMEIAVRRALGVEV